MTLDKRLLKILKRIYNCPYISIAEIKLLFPGNDTEDLLLWLQAEGYISFRIADCAEADTGLESETYCDSTHLLSVRKGNIAAEDTTSLRANIALFIAFASLIVSIVALTLR